MDEQNDPFAPESIDEQIEQFPMLLHSEDARLLNDLQASYRSYSRKNAASLAKVWRRVEQSKHVAASTHAPLELAAIDMGEERLKMYSGYTLDGSKRVKMHTIINTSVAVSIMMALVASIVIVFNVIHVTHNSAQISSHNNGSVILSSPTKRPTRPVQPAVKDSTGLYLVDALSFSDFAVDKLDLKSRTLLWHYDIGGNGSTVVVKGNIAYLTIAISSGTFVLALNANTGKKLWSTNLSLETQAAPQMTFAQLSDPTVDNGTVYIMSEDGQVFALNAISGKQRWKYASGNHFWSGNSRNNMNAVTVANNVVYGGVYNTLFAINASNGHQLWSREVANYLLLNQPQVSGDSLYVTSYEQPDGTPGQTRRGFLFAFNADNGIQRWQYQAGNWILSHAVVAGGIVYFGSYDTNVYALNTSNGSVRWKYMTSGQVFDAPVFVAGILYVAQAGNASLAQQSTVQASMLALNATNGNLLWEKTTSASVAGVNAGIIYASMFPRTMVGIDTKTGNILWQGQYGTDLINKLGGHSGPAPTITVVP